MDKSLWEKSQQFFAVMGAERPDDRDGAGLASRLQDIRAEIEETGSYVHTPRELEFGARLAWRNSNRCIGRHMFRSLGVIDCRDVTDAAGVSAALEDHVQRATNGGQIKSMITIFGARAPREAPRPDPVRVNNHQLIRYAGFEGADGAILGDPHSADFTRHCLEQGWSPRDRSAFTPLPWSISIAGEEHRPYDVFLEKPELLLEVELRHPEAKAFEQLGLKWYATPIVSDMALVIGGIVYPCAPFNGWYMGTEIGARNLADADRYNALRRVAAVFGLDTSSDRTLWRDRALIELNRAVLYSFDDCGIEIGDHHSLSRQFERFCRAEERRNASVSGDWAWLTPPITASQTPQYQRVFDETVCQHTNFLYQQPIGFEGRDANERRSSSGCPYTLPEG